MSTQKSDSQPPDFIWDSDELTHIHAAILFADFGSSEYIASVMPPRKYNSLINSFQQVVRNEIKEMKREKYPLAEIRIFGDELCLLLYDPQEVLDNYRLDLDESLSKEDKRRIIGERGRMNQELVYGAMTAAIRLKNAWLVSEPNITRLREHMQPLDLSVGLNYGWTFYSKRPDGAQRIEGYPISAAKRIERHARQGKISRIVASQLFYNVLRQSVRKHTQLKQRVFFDGFTGTERDPRQLAPSADLYELKFYHRIGVKSSPMLIKQYEAIFALDNANLWAYHQLMEHYAYQEKNWPMVYELAKKAIIVHAEDEKILLDIARYYYHNSRFDQAREFAYSALDKNDSFDLAHELLAQIAAKTGDDDMQLEHLRNAARLCPGSAVNNFNLGLQLLFLGQQEEGFQFIQEALRIYPDYPEHQDFRESLVSLKNAGKLPEILAEFLSPSMQGPAGLA